MTSANTATQIFRIKPELKEAVRMASVNERRSIANMIAVMIRDCCERVGVEIAELNVVLQNSQSGAKVARTGIKIK
jgi:hypothetical protein